MKDINKTIAKVSKRNLIHPTELYFDYLGKRYKVSLFRHYDHRDVSICNRATCNAGDDCCHYAKVDGVGLCCTLSSYFTLRVGKNLGHGIAFDIDWGNEEALTKFAQNILDILNGDRDTEVEVERINPT